MSGENKSISESLVLGDSDKGVVITGITDNTVAAKSGLQAGDEIVAATVHLNHLNKNEVLKILKALEPYDDNMKVLTKKELSVGAGLSPLGLHSAEIDLKKDLPFDASAPFLPLDGQNGKLNAEFSGPTVNGDLPNLSLNKPSTGVGTKFTMPSIGTTGTDLKGDLTGSLNNSSHQLNTSSASLDIKDSKVNQKKFTMPNFSMPQITIPKAEMGASGDVDVPSVNGSLNTTNLTLDPKLDLKGPQVDLSRPNIDLNGSGVNLEAPNFNVDAESGKLKWPHQKWKSPKVKTPDADFNADLLAPEVSISGQADIPTPDANIPKVDIKGPDLDVQGPNVEADARSGKIAWPHLKWKKQKIHGPDLDLDANLNTPDVSVPTMKAETNAPHIDINAPKFELGGPGVDMQTPNVDVETPSGKINWPHLKWKKNKGAKVDLDMNADLNTPTANLSVPKIEGGIAAPNAELNLPNADVGSGVDVHIPDIDTDTPSGKINWPHLKWKKPKVHDPKADFNTDFSTPVVDGYVPKVDADISAPDIDLSLPKTDVDVTAPNVNIEPPSKKFKWPTLKKYKVNEPDAFLNTDIATPDLDFSTPKIDGELSPTDVNLSLPKADLEGPKVDMNAPDIEGPSGKFKWLHIKKPKFGTLKGPKVDIDGNLKAPDVDLKGPEVDLKAPDFNLSAPKAEVGLAAPALNVNMPNADAKGPDVNVNGPKLPKLKLPTLKGSEYKLPELNAYSKEANIDVSPNVDLKAPNLSLLAPNVKGSYDVPDLQDIKAPTITGDLSTPAINLGTDVKNYIDPSVPKTNISAPGINFSSPKIKGSDVDIETDISAPSLDFSTPKIDGGINATAANLSLPKADLEGPKVDMNAPDIDGLSGTFKWFHFKKPKFGTLKGPKADIDADMKAPDVDLKGPEVDLKASGPDTQLQTPNLDFDPQVDKFKLPHFNVPEVDGPSFHTSVESGIPTADTNISVPATDLSPLKVEGNVIGPKIDMKAANVNIKPEKPELLHIKSPNLSFSGPNVKAQKVDNGAKLNALPDLKAMTPSLEGQINSPLVNASAPEANARVNTPQLDMAAESNAEVKSSQKSKLSWPFKWGLKSGSDTDEEGNCVDSETVDSNAEVPAFKFHKLPRMSFDGNGGIGDTFGLSRQDTEAKNYIVHKGIVLPVMNATSKSGERVNVLERLQVAKEKLPFAKSNIDLKPSDQSSDADAKMGAKDSALVRGDTFKIEKPESPLGLTAPDISTSDENDKLSWGLSNMLGLNVKDAN